MYTKKNPKSSLSNILFYCCYRHLFCTCGTPLPLRCLSYSRLYPFVAQDNSLGHLHFNSCCHNYKCNFDKQFWLSFTRCFYETKHLPQQVVGHFQQHCSERREAVLHSSGSTVWFTCLLKRIHSDIHFRVCRYWLLFPSVTSPQLHWTGNLRIEKAKHSLSHKRLFGTKSDPARPTWVLRFRFNSWTKDCCLILIVILF